MTNPLDHVLSNHQARVRRTNQSDNFYSSHIDFQPIPEETKKFARSLSALEVTWQLHSAEQGGSCVWIWNPSLKLSLSLNVFKVREKGKYFRLGYGQQWSENNIARNNHMHS